MKKNLQAILTVLLIGFGFGGISLASDEIGNNCIQEDLWDITTATICINNTETCKGKIEVTCEDTQCLANNSYYNNFPYTDRCVGDNLNYDEQAIEEIHVYIHLNDMQNPYEFKGNFDFQNGIRLNNGLESNSYNSATKNSSYIDASATKTTLDVGESADLIIKTNNDYTGDIFIKKQHYEIGAGRQYSNSSNAGWQYTMKSSDNGIKILSNFVKFNEDGAFRLEVSNPEKKRDAVEFTVNKKYIVIGGDEDTVDEEQEYDGEDYNNEEYDDEDYNNEEIEEDARDSLTQPVDKSRYEEGNQEIILSNGYSRELNNAYKFAYLNGITTMQDIKLANMDGNLNRISMAKMLSQYAMNVLKKTPDTSKRCSFSDVTMQIDSDYNNGVTLACQLGIMGIGIDKFRPYDEVTRAEFGTALSRMLFGLADGSPYYSTHLAKLKEEKIIDNDNPNLKELRGYVMLMLMRSAM